MSDEEHLAELTYRAPDFKPASASAGQGKEAFASDTREPYQRDLGRIIHSASFRRLQTKTQVMGTGEGDFHRTRLTHTLEVGQIGRGIVWNLAARAGCAEYGEWLPPSELMEAICYAHDLGHPPYGHAGERALHAKMRNLGGFEGNAQTIRILTRLEKYYKGSGIRPTRRLLLGVLKYPSNFSDYAEDERYAKPPKCYYDDDKPLIDNALSIFSESDRRNFALRLPKGKPLYKSFDCSIMELADDIAYGVHDLEDGIARGILQRTAIECDLRKGFADANVPSIRDVSISDLLDKLFSHDSCERKHGISLLVGFFILSIRVKARGVFNSPILDLVAYVDENIRTLLDHLSKDITFRSIVNRREVQTLEYKGTKIISDLFDAFAEHPKRLIGAAALDPFDTGIVKILRDLEKEGTRWQDAEPEKAKAVGRAITDFIAGMTNPYAEKYHRRLFEPGFGSSTDEF